jgi:hypothetical protein
VTHPVRAGEGRCTFVSPNLKSGPCKVRVRGRAVVLCRGVSTLFCLPWPPHALHSPAGVLQGENDRRTLCLPLTLSATWVLEPPRSPALRAPGVFPSGRKFQPRRSLASEWQFTVPRGLYCTELAQLGALCLSGSRQGSVCWPAELVVFLSLSFFFFSSGA